MRRLVPLLVLVAVVLGLLAVWLIFGESEFRRYDRVRKLAASPSDIRLWLVVGNAKGPIAREEYRLADHDGLSTESYAAEGRDGTTIRVESLPRETYDVSFFFERVVRDGIWELPDRPPRGDTSTSYTIGVEQTADLRHGAHTMRFTDPHYWATTGGREYRLRLDRKKPVPDLIRLQSVSLAEPRYERLVSAFRSFGSEGFREKAAAARRSVIHTAAR